MANKIKFKRGLKTNIPTLEAGEPAFITDTRELFIGTGSGNVNMSGSQWYTGTAMSGTSATTGAYSYSACPLVKVGDIYLNTSNGNVYQCTTAGSGTSAKWTYKECLRKRTYSTTPQQIGTWIDGTPVWRYCFNVTFTGSRAAEINEDAAFGMDDVGLPVKSVYSDFLMLNEEVYVIDEYNDIYPVTHTGNVAIYDLLQNTPTVESTYGYIEFVTPASNIK